MFTKLLFIKTLPMCFLVFLTSVIALQHNPVFAASIKTDPTKPPSVIVQQLATEIKPKTELKLTAIFKRDSKLYAVINGKLFSAGENLDDVNVDMRVEKISATKVVLRSNGEDAQKTELSVDNDAQLTKQVVQ